MYLCALTLMIWSQEGHLTCRQYCSSNICSFPVDQLEAKLSLLSLLCWGKGGTPLPGGRWHCVIPYGVWVSLALWQLCKLLYPCYFTLLYLMKFWPVAQTLRVKWPCVWWLLANRAGFNGASCRRCPASPQAGGITEETTRPAECSAWRGLLSSYSYLLSMWQCWCCMTNYELLCWLVKTPSCDIHHYWMLNHVGGRRFNSQKYWIITWLQYWTVM